MYKKWISVDKKLPDVVDGELTSEDLLLYASWKKVITIGYYDTYFNNFYDYSTREYNYGISHYTDLPKTP